MENMPRAEVCVLSLSEKYRCPSIETRSQFRFVGKIKEKVLSRGGGGRGRVREP